MTTRKNFSFRYEWSERIAHLSETIQYQILIGTVAYAKNGKFPADASPEARAAFEEFILPDFIKRAKAAEYRSRAKARKAAKQAETIQPQVEPASSESDTTPEMPRLSRAARRRLAREQMKMNRGHKKSPDAHLAGTRRG